MATRVALLEQLQAVELRIGQETSARGKIALASERSRLQMLLVHANTKLAPGAGAGSSASHAGTSGDGARHVRFSDVTNGRKSAATAVTADGSDAVAGRQLESVAPLRASPGQIWMDTSDPLADTLSGRRSRHSRACHKHAKGDADLAGAGDRNGSQSRSQRSQRKERRPSSGAEWRRVSDMSRFQDSDANSEESMQGMQESKIATGAPAPQCAVCAHRRDMGLKDDTNAKTCAACLLYQSATTASEHESARARSSSPLARRLIDRRVHAVCLLCSPDTFHTPDTDCSLLHHLTLTA